MTRFARSKGSKASNERVPEEATSWQVMKQQLEDKKQEVSDTKKRKEFEAVRKANYNAFLEERENTNTTENEWTVFENNRKSAVKTPKAKKKRETTDLDDVGSENEEELKELISKIEGVLQKEQGGSDEDVAPEEVSAKIAPKTKKTKVKLPKKVPLKIPSLQTVENDDGNVKDAQKDGISKKRKNKNDINEDKVKKSKKSMENEEISENKVKKSKKSVGIVETGQNVKKGEKNEQNQVKEGKTKGNSVDKSLEGLSEDQIKRIMKKRVKRQRQFEKRKIFKAEAKEKALKEEQTQQNSNNNNTKKQMPKVRDNKEHQKRKPNSEINKMYVNGVEIDIDYFDGFPIKKEDADRLHKLRKEMISKGIPRSEVQVALKLERRKAEKALTRERKKVCFNCRKSGHILSECPDLNDNTSQEIIGTGICFKCGSTEHTHFECRVTKKDEFKFATCFICREQGHISRQCPDNEKGLYPNGGACRVCGDVTHLKKDCPKYQAEQESENIKLDNFEFDNIESLPEEKGKHTINKSKGHKIVKF